MVAQIRRSLEAVELGQQECLDGILKDLEVIGSSKIGSEVRLRGWIPWESNVVSISCLLKVFLILMVS